jgi:hypothetical protein
MSQNIVRRKGQRETEGRRQAIAAASRLSPNRLVFHQNGLSTVSARLIALGSRLVGFGPYWKRMTKIGRQMAAAFKIMWAFVSLTDPHIATPYTLEVQKKTRDRYMTIRLPHFMRQQLYRRLHQAGRKNTWHFRTTLWQHSPPSMGAIRRKRCGNPYNLVEPHVG